VSQRYECVFSNKNLLLFCIVGSLIIHRPLPLPLPLPPHLHRPARECALIRSCLPEPPSLLPRSPPARRALRPPPLHREAGWSSRACDECPVCAPSVSAAHEGCAVPRLDAGRWINARL
jgi:hypothetical protein